MYLKGQPAKGSHR